MGRFSFEYEQRMLERLGSEKPEHDQRADPAKAYVQQMKAARAWLGRHGIPAIAVDYNALVGDAPEQAPAEQVRALAEFLGCDDCAPVMANVVDPALYRVRG